MANEYFDLSKKQRLEIINATEAEIGLSATIIEKDIWLCWVLKCLFELDCPIAFKGGTSLSKVYNLIQRFSEDIDITINYRHFTDFNFFDSTQSKSQIKKENEKLKSLVTRYVQQNIIPYLQSCASRYLNSHHLKVDNGENPEEIRVYYPTILTQTNEYVQESILIEFGGRNTIEPNNSHLITPYASMIAQDIEFPQKNVSVLSPERTFWEKVTLIHVECHRGRLRNNSERLSRHWYDISKIVNSDIGKSAIKNRSLLEDVIHHKKIFFNASYANYDECLKRKFKLIPEGNELTALKSDFNNMISARMFYNEEPKFNEIINVIHQLQDMLNS